MEPPGAVPEVMVACTHQNLGVFADALRGAVRLVPVREEDEAIGMLDRSLPRLLVCTLRFDESRMLDFVAVARARHPGLRWICCRTFTSDLDPVSLDAAFVAARSLGALEVVDLPELEGTLGTVAARERLRTLLLSHVRDA